MVLGAASMICALPVASAAVALLWKFPVMMAGTVGGNVGAATGAAFTTLAWMTLFSAFLGVLVAAGIGAGVGRLLSTSDAAWTVGATVLISLLAAFRAAYVSAQFESGPSWIHVHVGGPGPHQAAMGGHLLDPEPPRADSPVTVRAADSGEVATTTTGAQGTATVRVPNGEYAITTPCGRVTVDVSIGEHRHVSFRCTR